MNKNDQPKWTAELRLVISAKTKKDLNGAIRQFKALAANKAIILENSTSK